MKRNLFYVAPALLCMGFMASCSDDNDDKLPAALEEKTYTSQSGLDLEVDEVPAIGKTVKFTPDATDERKGTITISSTFDLNTIPGFGSLNVSDGEIQAPGVIPGSPVTVIPVTLVPDGDDWRFSGEGESEYCTYSYEGDLTATKCDIDIKNVRLKNKALAGTVWNLAPLSYDEDGIVSSSPTHLVWEPEDGAYIEIDLGFGQPMPFALQTILQLVCQMPLISNPADQEGDNLSVNDMLNYTLEKVTFLEDGNIIASYRDVAHGGTEFVNSPKGIVQYVIKTDGTMLVFLNPQAIAAADSNKAKSAADSLLPLVQQVAQGVIPMLANGIPVNYTVTGNVMSAYLGTDLLLPLLKAVVVPLATNDELVGMLLELVANDPDMASMAGMLEGAIKSLPKALNNTTKLEIGLNFTKAN